MTRQLLLALVSAMLASCVVASASSLGGVAAPPLSAGADTVRACDTTGLTTAYTTEAGKVAAVTVGGVADPGCEGAAVSLTLVSNGGSRLGSGGPTQIAADADTADSTVVVVVDSRPRATAVAGVHIVIEGP